MKVRVDPDLCISCQLCVEMCPAVFFLEDDIAKAVSDAVTGSEADCAREAIEECPTDAIVIDS